MPDAGVYQLGCGSSPPARGAPRADLHRCAACGIIPAGAGSTFCSVWASYEFSDHPRGRREHGRRARQGTLRDGSSPRARGAQRNSVATFYHSRIIPRGRGEHMIDESGSARDAGSSPRARGALQHEARRRIDEWIIARGALRPRPSDRSVRRIIPAGAGSTPTRMTTVR